MTEPATRFQFGGHATFPVRYGWLPKGLNHLASHSSFTANLETADDLGIGSKMVESLGYWMSVMGLAQAGRGGMTPLPTADLIRKNDPYFELPGTWWFLHLMLARREGTVWNWFFNDYSDRIFDRITATDAFHQHATAKAQRAPSVAMVQRDMACLMSAYAARPGADVVDPDDIGACPLRELGLVIRHDTVNRFERTRRPQGVPAEVFLASAALLAGDLGVSAVSLRQLASARGGPGRILCMGMDAIETQVGKIRKTDYWKKGIQVETTNGEKQLLITGENPDKWLKALYERLNEQAD